MLYYVGFLCLTIHPVHGWFLAKSHGSLADTPEMPVESFSAHQQNKQARTLEAGKPLRQYTEEPTSNRLEAKIDMVKSLDKSLSMYCRVPEGQTIKTCSWTSPKGDEFLKSTDEVRFIDTDSQNCHITVDKLKENHLGTWTCRVHVEGHQQFQEAYLTATNELPVKDVRLPLHLRPEQYNIYLTPFIVPNNFSIEGYVEINMDIDHSQLVGGENQSHNITLHINEIKIYENTVKVQDEAGNDIPVAGHGYDKAREFYVVKLKDQLKKDNHKLSVTMAFLGDLNDDLSGFYRSLYVNAVTNQTHYIAASQMEATDARRALPCFDEPAMKAKFQVNLGRTKEMTSISNMPITTKGLAMADNDEYVWDVYEVSLKMSTYLLAFIVSDFTFRQSAPRPNGVEFKIWSRGGALEQTAYAADIGPKILEYYEEFFDIPFPLPKQDMIAIPDFSAGAMENWGLITYRETALLYEPGISSVASREYVATVVAHELAHQWFGDLVTMEWWEDLWLNEGFASYVENIGTDHVEPETSILDRFCLETMYNTFALDALQTSHPISVKVNHPNEINEIFDSISYGKGASIIRMMAYFLGQHTFKTGLTKYLNKHKYSNAVQDDLWQSLTEVAHQDGTLAEDQTVKEIMDTWTLQMGYPVVTVTRDYSTNKVQFHQERYLTSKTRDSSDAHDYKWWVPITYDMDGGTFTNTQSSFWLQPFDQNGQAVLTIDVPNDKAFIVNNQQTGYYRVNYDKQNWGLIAKALKNNYKSINRVNRGQILNDAFNLARSDLLDYNTTLLLTKYLSLEDDYIPWQSALGGFSYLKEMLERTAAFGSFKKYLETELQKPYQQLGFTPSDQDSFTQIKLRESVISWMCKLGNDDCEEKSKTLFGQWKNSNDPGNDANNPIDPGLRQTIYCSAVKQGDEKEVAFLWQIYQLSNNANEKKNILSAIACTSEVWILKQYLDMTLDPNSGIRKQDGATVITGIANNNVGRYMTWNWLRNKWSEISRYFDTAISSAVGSTISACTKDFNTPFELQELEAFYQEHMTELGTAKRSTTNAIESVKANVQWMDNYYKEIHNWLQNH